jgi:hypothetical protein
MFRIFISTDTYIKVFLDQLCRFSSMSGNNFHHIDNGIGRVGSRSRRSTCIVTPTPFRVFGSSLTDKAFKEHIGVSISLMTGFRSCGSRSFGGW